MMNRNTASRFSLAPQVATERSTFPLDTRVLTSFDCGQCIPAVWYSVLPGDTFKVSTSKVCRMQTLKTPMMDDVYLDTYWFFVPNRLLWTHWEEFMGANKTSAWIPEVEYILPQIEAPSGGWAVGSIADYLGVPPLVDNLTIKNALPFRCYSIIMDEWFRSDSIMDPLVMEKGDSTVTGSNGSNYIQDVDKGGAPFIACRNFDMFSSALWSPQRGPEVQINSLSSPSLLPVYATAYPNEHYWKYGSGAEGLTKYDTAVKAAYPMQLESAYTYKPSGATTPFPKVMTGENLNSGSCFAPFGLQQPTATTLRAGAMQAFHNDNSGESTATRSVLGVTNNMFRLQTDPETIDALTPVNLVAESSGKYLFTSINDLREAFQIQRFYEKAARYGSGRYIEIIRAHFGVTSPDARMQRPEYLGGNRIRLNVRQITQTSSTTETSPMGDVAGMSVTTDKNFDFEKSFTEHGYLMCILVARYDHTYQQGLDRDFQRSGKFSFYWPEFAHLGEQGITNQTLYVQGYDPLTDVSDVDNEIFGYQEAWFEYRFKPNSVSAQMRSVSNSGLDSWHLADYYTELPTLSAGWLQEDKTNLDRVLTVTSAVSNQIFADIYVDCTATRPMPLYSIPGLIDHF